MGYAAEGDVHDLVDRAQAEVYDLTSGRTSEDYSPLRDIFDGTLNEIEAIASHGGQMVGVPTGFADLDALTNGLHPGSWSSSPPARRSVSRRWAWTWPGRRVSRTG